MATQPLSGWAVFTNALPEAVEYANKNAGIRPAEIGLEVRRLNRKGTLSDGPVLGGCSNVANCVATFKFKEKDTHLAVLIEPWRMPAGMNVSEAVSVLRSLIADYKPGQGGIDQGGFRIAEVKPGYIYAQFAQVSTLIDDVEFAPREDGTVLIRSSTRTKLDASGGTQAGADGGTNVQRLNFFSSQLRQAGWTAPEITKETHPEYFKANGLT